MNEILIKELIKYKLKVVNTTIDYLPAEISEGLRNLGRIILESVNENSRETQTGKKTKDSNKLDNVPIE